MKEKQKGMNNMDFQPSTKQFAGKEFGKTNMYMERKDRELSKEAGKIRKQEYKGKYV